MTGGTVSVHARKSPAFAGDDNKITRHRSSVAHDDSEPQDPATESTSRRAHPFATVNEARKFNRSRQTRANPVEACGCRSAS
jgi:hypothetical protein